MIDWTTVAFQIVNFLILLFLLKHFLYGRIIEAMDQREARIAESLQQAEDKQRQAEKKAQEFQNKSQELDAQREEFLTQAKKDAQERRKELLDQARQEVDQSRKQWAEALEREKDGFLDDLRTRVSRQTLDIARRTLDDLADAELEAKIVDGFLARLEQLDEGERKTFANAVAQTQDDEGQTHVLARTAFDLSEEQQGRVADALRQHVAEGLDVDFATSGEVIGGIEVSAAGAKLAWSIAHYLGSLEEDLAEQFQEAERAEADAQAEKHADEKEESDEPPNDDETDQ